MAGTFALADAPGWQRLAVDAPAARLKLRILSVHGSGRPGIGEVAVFAGLPAPVAAAETEQPEPVEPPRSAIVPLERVAGNEVLRLGLYGYSASPTYLGRAAPEGATFLALRGAIENLSANKPLSLPAVEEVFSLSLGVGGLARPDEANRLGAYPFTGPVVIEPGRRRPFTLVFAALDPLPEETALVLAGTTASALTVPLFEMPAVEALAEVATDALRLAVTGYELVPSAGGVDAPPRRRLALVDVSVERLGDQALVQALADFAVAVEDDQYVTPPHDAGRSLSPHLYSLQRYDPGVSVSGRLAFVVPEDAGDLALVVFTGEGPLALDLTPDLEPAAKPAPIAASGEGLVTASLLGASQSAEPGERVVVLDLGLILRAERWYQSFAFDPSQGLELHDAQGRVWRPRADPSGLRRPLTTVPLWPDRPARGEVSFAVADDAAGFTLVIPFRDNPVRMPLPDELFPVPTVVAVKQPEDQQPEDDESSTAAAEVEPALRAESASVGLAASDPVWAGEINRVLAAPGKRFLSFDLTLTNRSAVVIAQAVADYSVVVEDGQYTYAPHPLTAELGSALAATRDVAPGESLSGRLVYELPATTGALAFVYFAPDGPVALDLAPAPARPPPAAVAERRVALQGGDANLTVAVFEPADTDLPPPPTGGRYVVADFALRLESADPLATLPLDPRALFVLRDEAGGTYRPAEAPLARPFAKTELWSGQTSRGQLAYLVPAGTGPLSLELPGYASLPLPFGAAPTAAAAAEKTVLALEPPPALTEGACQAVEGGPPAALFLGEDSVTGGDWQGTYGGDGYVLISHDGAGQDASSLPAYLDAYAYSETTEFYVWAGETVDARAPASPSGGRVAATAFSGEAFALTLSAADSTPHTLALYFLDWDTHERAQEVALYDAGTGALLDRRAVTRFYAGTYYVYEVQGSVRIEITRTGGWNAVLAGVFWDPAASAAESEVAAAFADVAAGAQQNAVLTVRRGGQMIPFTVTGAGEAAPGLTGRYLSGPGYGRLLVERRDPAISFWWWRDARSFPDEDVPATDEPLWAEWEGALVVPRQQEPTVVSLADGATPGLALEESAAGVCIESVEPGSAAEAAGLKTGDIVTRVIDARVREMTEVALRLDAPAGGQLFVDGLRVLATDSAPVEASRKFEAEERRVRVAAVRRQGRAEEPAEKPPGPTLSWRLPGMSDFEPVPSSALRARPEPGSWRRTPRQAAQVGLEWLQSAAVEWQRQQNCSGCHVQSQALLAMAIGRDNDYVVSDEAYADLLDGFARYQNADGSWHSEYHATATQFGAMALATAHRRGKEGRNDTLLRAVRYVRDVQDEDGRVGLDHNQPPIDQGDFLATANARIAFSVGAELAPPEEAGAIRDAEKRALAWLAAAEPTTNQDRALRVLGLAIEDRRSVRELLAAARADLLARQRADGGWAEVEGRASTAFATGQTLYALKVAGQSVASAPFQRGVDWLLANQLWTGAWATSSSNQIAATMWPVIALVGSFQAVGVETVAQSCLEGTVELATRVVTEEVVEQVRFLIDEEVVGTAETASDGLYRALWSAATVAPGAHDLRIEALQEGAVRGEDQTVVHTAPVGSRCAGALGVASAGEPIAGAAAPNIELILDASGSMKERKRKVGGRLKIDVAKDLMAETIAGLPDGVTAGLRVYGRTVPEGRDGDCTDSQLVLPFSRIDKARLIAAVQSVEALGTTPLAFSLVQAARDLAAVPGDKLILLVTDGKEECGGSPREVAARLVELGMKLRVDVVGFALAEEAVKREMERVAEITGGRFFDAQSADERRRALRGALAAPYNVIDADGSRVGGGVIDRGVVDVPAGTYTVAVRGVDDVTTIANVPVAYGKLTSVTLTKTGAEVEAEIAGPSASVEASWSAAPSAERAPAVASAPETPETLARLTEALDEIERDLAAAQTRAPEADPRVREAQQRLAELGFDPGPADGLSGGRTAGAVRAFQEWYPRAELAATGALDEPTVAALADAVASGLRREAERPEPQPAPPAPAPAVEAEPPALEGVATVLDTGNLVIGGRIVRLLGVRGELGEASRTFERYLAGQTVACRPAGADTHRCTVGGQDLSRFVLLTGGGRATADAPADLKEAEAEARARRLGVWR